MISGGGRLKPSDTAGVVLDVDFDKVDMIYAEV